MMLAIACCLAAFRDTVALVKSCPWQIALPKPERSIGAGASVQAVQRLQVRAVLLKAVPGRPLGSPQGCLQKGKSPRSTDAEWRLARVRVRSRARVRVRYRVRIRARVEVRVMIKVRLFVCRWCIPASCLVLHTAEHVCELGLAHVLLGLLAGES